MYTTAFRDATLNTLDSQYVLLLKSLTGWRAGTITEADYTSYARVALTLGAAGNTTPTGGRQRANTGTLTFPANTGSSQDVIGWGIISASSGGTLQAVGMLSADAPVAGVVTSASPGVVTAPNHGLSANQRVFAQAAPGAPLPTGFSEDTAYFVGTVPDADSFTLSTTTANANPVNTTSDGAGLFIPYEALSVATSQAPEIAVGALIVQF